MRIERIEMSWFRGAGRGAKLEAKAKSVAVYGANGSGKSTFADAIEYVVSGGRLGHLAHEYSGRRQVLGIRNTHAPNGEESAVHLCLEGQAQIKAVIASSGGVAMEGEPDGALAAVQEWDLRTVLLRQDEVAAFIHARKSSKYSVLLPLLGLDEMEQAAQNMHQLGRAIEKRGELDVLRERRRERRAFASECLPDTTVACAAETLRAKARQYLAEDATEQVRDLARALDAAIVERMESLDPEHKRHILFQQVQNSDLQGRLAVVIKTDWAAQEALGELLDTKIAVLEAAAEFVQAAGTDHETVECPACGDPKDHAEFTAHILAELEALDDARHARDAAARARGALARALDDVDRIAGEDVMRAWLEATEVRDCRDAVANLGTIDRRSLEDRCPSDTQALLQASIPIVGIAVEAAAAATPPPIAQLSDDKRLVEACRAVFEVQTLQARIREIEQLVDGLTTAESAVRQALRDRTTEITEEISADVQQLWAKMHPDEPIEAIQIYAPEDADKAIDIGLRFYGVDQDSPRLTLSEGHRNSLGLCIFLALAKRDDDQDRPIVLDDIVTSLDREHRGMVAEVLLDDFNHRQVIILTHDREWYTVVAPPPASKGMAFHVVEALGPTRNGAAVVVVGRNLRRCEGTRAAESGSGWQLRSADHGHRDFPCSGEAASSPSLPARRPERPAHVHRSPREGHHRNRQRQATSEARARQWVVDCLPRARRVLAFRPPAVACLGEPIIPYGFSHCHRGNAADRRLPECHRPLPLSGMRRFHLGGRPIQPAPAPVYLRHAAVAVRLDDAG